MALIENDLIDLKPLFEADLSKARLALFLSMMYNVHMQEDDMNVILTEADAIHQWLSTHDD